MLRLNTSVGNSLSPRFEPHSRPLVCPCRGRDTLTSPTHPASFARLSAAF